MPLRQKLGLCILLALGIFTMGASIAKSTVAESGTKAKADKQYKSSLSLMWSSTEQSFVIMMGCAPSLSSITRIRIPLVERFTESMRRLVSSRGSESKVDSTTGRSTGLGRSKNGIYYELGVAGQNKSDVQGGTKSSVSSVDAKRILRTDQFAVKSDRAGEP